MKRPLSTTRGRSSAVRHDEKKIAELQEWLHDQTAPEELRAHSDDVKRALRAAIDYGRRTRYDQTR